MAITLYIWSSKPFGHCALEIGSEYISFYPGQPPNSSEDQGGKAKKANGISSFSWNNNSVRIFGYALWTRIHAVSENYEEDCNYLGKQDQRREADYIVNIPNLNSEAMLSSWISMKHNKTSYEFLKRNCAMVIAEIINVGYDSYLRKIKLSKSLEISKKILFKLFKPENIDGIMLWHDRSFIDPWTPDQVLKYASAVKRILE